MGLRTSPGQKVFLAATGIVLSLVIVELMLRLGGFLFLFLQERRNIASIKARGEYRIMCLGESTTALGGRDSYPSQLEEILNRRSAGIKFSVINKGVPASNSTAIALQAEENINTYKPDMVIAMMGINDGDMRHMSYRDSSSPLQQLKVYNFFRLLAMHRTAKTRARADKPHVKISEDSKRGTGEEVRYITLGWQYKQRGEFDEAIKSFKKAIEINSWNEEAFLGLGYSCLEVRDYPEMEKAFEKVIEINPRNGKARVFLGHMFYCCLGKVSEGEALLKKAIEIEPGNEEAYFELGWFYCQQNMPIPAYGCFRKIIELNPRSEKAYGALATLCAEIGKQPEAEGYYNKIKELERGYYNPVTTDNYRKLKKLLDKKAVKLVCVQYPIRSIGTLKEIFYGDAGVLFVDNESIFKEALKRESYKEYFSDMFAGDFGHCTRKGNGLLAENIAEVIAKEVPGR
jgi:tetratricopeptide (TPR) repeat protein